MEIENPFSKFNKTLKIIRIDMMHTAHSTRLL